MYHQKSPRSSARYYVSQALGKTVMLPEQETQTAGSLCGLAILLPESSSPTCSHPESHHCLRAEQSPHHLKSPVLPGMLMFMYTAQVKWRETHPLVPGSQHIMEGPGPHGTALAQLCAALSHDSATLKEARLVSFSQCYSK